MSSMDEPRARIDADLERVYAEWEALGYSREQARPLQLAKERRLRRERRMAYLTGLPTFGAFWVVLGVALKLVLS
jgi:hypothetical protein